MGLIRCLNCAEILAGYEPYAKEPAGKGKPRPPCPLQEEGDKAFYLCPSCHAKNIVEETRTALGFPELKVVACLLR
jgi:hypothetical protein